MGSMPEPSATKKTNIPRKKYSMSDPSAIRNQIFPRTSAIMIPALLIQTSNSNQLAQLLVLTIGLFAV